MGMLKWDDKEVVENLERLSSEDLRRDWARSLFTGAELIMTAAKRQTPVRTGALRNTGLVQPPRITARTISVLLGFGGPAVGYAAAVHENLKAKHLVGNAKYLERPFKANSSKILKKLGVGIRQEIKKNVRRRSR